MRLPPDKTLMWTQTNRSDLLGTLRGSFNLDLTKNPGKTLTTGMVQTTFQTTNTDLTAPAVAFKAFPINGTTKLWTIAGSRVHSNNGVPGGAFTVDATSGSPTVCDSNYSDMEILGNAMYVTTNSSNTVYYINTSGTWASFAAGSTSTGYPRLLCKFGNRLYTSSGGINIYSWNESRTVAGPADQYGLVLDNTYDISFLKATSNRIWIGMVNNKKGRGLVHEWDGSSSQVLKTYTLDAIGALSCVIKDDVPYVMDSSGRLLVWNTGTFQEVARLPLNNKYLTNPNTAINNRWIHPNGMAVIDDNIHILINNQISDSAGSIEEFCPSGIWEYSSSTGLYHKYSLSYTPVGSTTITGWGQNRLSAVGALANMKIDSTSAGANGSFLAGATIFTTQSATTNGIFINDTLNTTQKVGYLVTNELMGKDVSTIWQDVFLSYRRLLNSSDKIVAKYRITKQDPTEMTITWTSTTTFTTTDANMANFAVGDEVEITRGKGGGMCSHITAISSNAGTYTVTVDETHTGATSGTASARLQKWIKMDSVADQINQFKKMSVGGAQNPWIQFKIFFVFTGDNQFTALYPVGAEYQ